MEENNGSVITNFVMFTKAAMGKRRQVFKSPWHFKVNGGSLMILASNDKERSPT